MAVQPVCAVSVQNPLLADPGVPRNRAHCELALDDGPKGDLRRRSNTWQDCSGNGNTAALSGSGLAESRSDGNGATSEVLALSGTTSSQIAFGTVIQSEFTVCSVTRYTGGAMERILQGGGANWLHGHHGGNAGVAFYYRKWNTRNQGNVSPNTDWAVMCGTNAGSQLKLVNGVDVGTGTGGTGSVSLCVNDGYAGHQKSSFAVAEVVVWPRGLTSEEMHRASEHITNRIFGPSPPPPPPPSSPPMPPPLQPPLSSLLKLSAVATLSSLLARFPPSNCVDGDLDTICHTRRSDGVNPSLTLDLGTAVQIAYVVVYNRRHCCQARLGSYTVAYRVGSGDPWAVCSRVTAAPNALGPLLSECSQLAQYVMVQLPGSNRILNLAEVEVYSFPPPPQSPPPPSPPPPSSPVPRCEAAAGLSTAAMCTQSVLDPYWGGGSFDCSALIDGDIKWSRRSGRHVQHSSTVTISWQSVRLVEEIVVYQLHRHGDGSDAFGQASFAGFELQVQSPRTSAWTTVLAQTSWSQNETTTPGLIQRVDSAQNVHITWFTLPVPMLTKAVRFQGTRSSGDWLRMTEIGVTGCSPQCDATIALTAAASCSQSEVDPHWGRGSLDCSALTNGDTEWGSSTSRHVYPSGSVTLSWPDVVLVETIAVYQSTDGPPQDGFELQVQSLTTSAWTTVLAQTSWSQNETTTPGLTQNGHDTTYILPEPMLTTAIRFEGKRTTPPSCSLGVNGSDYRGALSTTGSGLDCQAWTSQTPHTHTYGQDTAIGNAHGLGDHNFCRNPTGGASGLWCYTMVPSVRWAYCSQIPECSPPAQPPSPLLPPPPPPLPCFGGGNTSLEVTTSLTLDTDASPDGFSFSSLVVAAGATLYAIGSNPLIINAEAFVDIQGTIDLSGGKGGNSAGDHMSAGGGAGGGALKISALNITIGPSGAIHVNGGDGGDGGGYGQSFFGAATPWSTGAGNGAGGVSVAGGGAGGAGGGSGQPGHAGSGSGASAGGRYDEGVPPGAGGAGHAFAGKHGFGQWSGWKPAGGPAYGDVQLTGGLQGGSGAGGGGNDGDNEEGAGGGGSGGTIYLVAATLRIEGAITATGGLGGRDDYHYNGGANRECCDNGGAGSVGRIRLDYDAVSGSSTITPAAGYISTYATPN